MSIALRSFPGAFLASVLLAMPAGSAAAQAPQTAAPESAVWTIDASHSELTFSIRHLVSRVRGQFSRWGGTIEGDLEDWQGANVSVTIDAASIDTNHDKRDGDLRGSEFFDAERHPTITFRSTRIEQNGDRVRLTGDLTMRGITHPVVLEGSFQGVARDQRGRERAGFEVSGTINRKDYGIVWNRMVEAGGVVLGDEVRIDAAIAAVK